MKIESNDSKFHLYLKLIPETPEEVAMLARYAMNAKKKKPEIYLNLDGAPRMAIYLDKTNAHSSQKTTLIV